MFIYSSSTAPAVVLIYFGVIKKKEFLTKTSIISLKIDIFGHISPQNMRKNQSFNIKIN